MASTGRKMEGFGNNTDIHNKPAPNSMWHAVSRFGSTIMNTNAGYTGDDVKKAGADVLLRASGICKHAGTVLSAQDRARCNCAGCRSWADVDAASVQCRRKAGENALEAAHKLRQEQMDHPYKKMGVRYLPLSLLELQGENLYKPTPPPGNAGVSYRKTPTMDDRDKLNCALVFETVEGEVRGDGWLKVEKIFNVDGKAAPGVQSQRGYQRPTLPEVQSQGGYQRPTLPDGCSGSSNARPAGPWGQKKEEPSSSSIFAFVNPQIPDPKPESPATHAAEAANVDLLGDDEAEPTTVATVDLLGGAVEGESAKQEARALTDLLMMHASDGQDDDDLIGLSPAPASTTAAESPAALQGLF